jgi:hypothetical protein
MNRIFSKVSTLMLVLVAFILIVVPKITHADSGSIVFGEKATPESVSDHSLFFRIQIVTSSSPIANIIATFGGKIYELMLTYDRPGVPNSLGYFGTYFPIDDSVVNGKKDIIVTATDINGYSLSHTYPITLNISGNPYSSAQLILGNGRIVDDNGYESVQSDQPFELVYRMNNITQAVYGQDITMTFDSAMIDFISAESLNSDVKVLAIKTTKVVRDMYKIHMVISSSGQNSNNTGLFKLQFKTKPFSSITSTFIELNKVIIAESNGNETHIDAHDSYYSGLEIIINSPDKTMLNKAITIAQSLYDTSTEGNTVGSYIIGSKALLKITLDKAKSYSSHKESSENLIDQNAIDSVTFELEKSIEKFKDSVFVPGKKGDMNNDSMLTVGDVGIMSSYSGKSTVSSDWNIVKIADLNNDGKIGIEDLTLLANMVLEYLDN